MASSAEDDDDDVGEVSGAEEPDIDFTEEEGLRRLPSEEAQPLVGEEGATGDGRGADGQGQAPNGGGGGGADGRGEAPNGGGEGGGVNGQGQAPNGGGGGGGSGGNEGDNDFDAASEATVSLPEVDENHEPEPGACHIECFNDYVDECPCECETCMFKYRITRPRTFQRLLRENFQNPESRHLTDPKQRNFRKRRPYDYTRNMANEPCTQMIPWNASITQWTDPCPNEDLDKYPGQTFPCLEKDCEDDLYKLGDVYGLSLPGELWCVDRQYVCEDHLEDHKDYFEMGPDAQNLYKSHLIRFCQIHETELLTSHRATGLNTCTCRNVSFTRPQCRSCFESKVMKLQQHFRARVTPAWRGNADTTITDNYHYQGDWRGVLWWGYRQAGSAACASAGEAVEEVGETGGEGAGDSVFDAGEEVGEVEGKGAGDIEGGNILADGSGVEWCEGLNL